jgi:hypothetical protein
MLELGDQSALCFISPIWPACPSSLLPSLHPHLMRQAPAVIDAAARHRAVCGSPEIPGIPSRRRAGSYAHVGRPGAAGRQHVSDFSSQDIWPAPH